MTTPLTADLFTTATPVIVGGALAIAGGVASQLLVHVLTRRRERQKLRVEKIESLLRAVFAQTRWLKERSSKLMFRNEDHDEPWPIEEAFLIQELYFPQLAAEAIAVHEACMPLVTFMNQQRIKHMKDRELFIKEYDPEPFNAAYKTYIGAVRALTTKCRALVAE